MEEPLTRAGLKLERVEGELRSNLLVSVWRPGPAVSEVVTYSREAKDGGDGKQPVGAIGGQILVPGRGVGVQGIIASV